MLAVMFVTTCPTGYVNNVTRRHIFAFLESTAPGYIREAGVNPRKNVVAVSASTPALITSLLSTALLFGGAVLSYVPWVQNTIVRLIQDADADITGVELSSLIILTTDTAEIHRYGASPCIKMVLLR